MTKNQNTYTSKFFESVSCTLDDVHKTKLQLAIPFSQRPWAWKKDKLEVLWEDLKKTLEDFYKKNDSGDISTWTLLPDADGIAPHFFGGLVFVDNTEEGNRQLEVVDGQQRMTSIAILFSILREQWGILESDPNINAQQKNNAAIQKTNIMKWLFTGENGDLPLIRADQEHIAFYNAAIFTPQNHSERNDEIHQLTDYEKELNEHKRLKDSLEHLRNLVIKDIDQLKSWESKVSFLNAIYEILTKRFAVIVSYITSESFSYKVFLSLNAKGEKLTPTDNVKNALFEETKIQFHEQLISEWRKLRDQCLRNNIGDFLRRRYIAAYSKPCPPNKLYEIIFKEEIAKSNINNNNGALNLIKNWVKDATLLKQIFEGSHYALDNETKDIIKAINLLGITLSEIIILKAAKTYLPNKKDNFKKICQYTLNLAFREIIIRKEKTSKVDDAFLKASSMIDSNESSVENVRHEFRKISGEHDFKISFSTRSEENTKIQYYILYQIEKYLSKNAGNGLSPYPHSPQQHVEHILPQKLSKQKNRINEWAWARKDPELHKAYVNRLGNLAILGKEINIKIQNFEFEAKRTGNFPGRKNKTLCYLDSGIKHVLDLTDQNKYPEWTKKYIDLRQSEMAEYATKIWEI